MFKARNFKFGALTLYDEYYLKLQAKREGSNLSHVTRVSISGWRLWRLWPRESFRGLVACACFGHVTADALQTLKVMRSRS